MVEILNPTYDGNVNRVDVNGTGDLFHFADIVAAKPGEKTLFVQVKGGRTTIGKSGLNSYRRTAMKVLDESHCRFEVWDKNGTVWDVYDIPLENRRLNVDIPGIEIGIDGRKARMDYQFKRLTA